MLLDLTTLHQTLNAIRDCGQVTFLVNDYCEETFADLLQAADFIAQQAGFSHLIQWRPINDHHARLLVLNVLHKDMAYQTVLMNIEKAQELTDKVFAAFGDSAALFTNGIFHEVKHLNGLHAFQMKDWMPLTHSRFDTGIVAVLPQRVGIFWVQDND
jgi:hypothetical protein